MDFNFDNLYTNQGDIHSLKLEDIGYASDNLQWLMEIVKEEKTTFLKKIVSIEDYGDLHPFCVIDNTKKIATAAKEDFNNFAYFYKVPTKDIYEPLDLHNEDDIRLLMTHRIVREYGYRWVIGVDSNTCTAIIANYDGYPEEHYLDVIEAEELLKDWHFEDGSKIGKLVNSDTADKEHSDPAIIGMNGIYTSRKETILAESRHEKFDYQKLYDDSQANEVTPGDSGYVFDNLEDFKKNPSDYSLATVLINEGNKDYPYTDGQFYCHYQYFYQAEAEIAKFED